jgi:hypothetical protein
MKNLFLALSLALVLPTVAQAGFMIEPYLGYETGTLKQTGSEEIKHKGTNLGARLGYQILGLKFGLDYMQGTQTSEQTGSADGDYKPIDMGAFVGYEFPFLLQVYASYFVSSKASVSPSSLSGDLTGKGTRVGIGWTGLPFVVINLEMITRSYEKWGEYDLDGKLEGTSTGLSLSLPLP